jgi:hypothetical protein
MRDFKELSTQLGYYIGEYIVHRYLPTLSCDSLHSYNSIKVTDEEEAEHERLEKEWFSKTHAGGSRGDYENSKTEWEQLRAYANMLKIKYIPEKLECYLPVLDMSDLDIDSFKQGLGVSLWDCDFCYYSIKPEDIEIIMTGEKYEFPKIILKRD